MTITVASWPGYGTTQNNFLRIFLDGLTAANCTVHSLDSIDAMASLDGVDIVLIHWPQRVFWEADGRTDVPAKIVRLIRAVRSRADSIKLVWLAHDLRPHDAQGMQRLLWAPFMAALTREFDGFITLSSGTIETVRNAYPLLARKPALAVRHPAYPDQSVPDSQVSALRSAAGLEPSDRVIGYCGQLRNNKGLDILARAFLDLEMPDARLFVAGSPTRSAPQVVDDLRASAVVDRRIHLQIGDLDDEGFRSALAICDVFAAPFRDYLHSGSLIHALSANRPVLTPKTPFSDDLLDDVGQQWVHTYSGVLTARHLEAVLARPRPPGTCLRSDFDADRIGGAVAAWFDQLVSQ